MRLKYTSFKAIGKLFIVVAILAFSGCRTRPPEVLISSNPLDAFVRIDETAIGRTPVYHKFEFPRDKPTTRITASKTGYLDETLRVTSDHPMIRRKVVEMVLQEDEGYRMTTESEATNNWIRVQVNPSLNQEQVWQRVIDSATTSYDSIEQMDLTSGYIKTTPKVRTFRIGGRGEFRIRTYLVGSIATTDPFTYRFQIRSQIQTPQSTPAWNDYGRIFHEDAQLVEELQLRIGI